MRYRIALSAGIALLLAVAAVVWIMRPNIVAKPDLVFTDLTINYDEGRYYWQVMNVGNVDSDVKGEADGEEDNVLVNVYLSNTQDLGSTADDVEVVSHRMPDNNYGGMLPVLENVPSALFFPTQAQNYCDYGFLKIYVDVENIIDEVNEDNNGMVIPIDCRILPDLIVSEAVIDFEKETYTATIKNVGRAPAPLGIDFEDDGYYGHVSLGASYGDDLSTYGTNADGGGGLHVDSTFVLAPGETYSELRYFGGDICAWRLLLVRVSVPIGLVEANPDNNVLEVPIQCP